MEYDRAALAEIFVFNVVQYYIEAKPKRIGVVPFDKVG